MNIIIRTDASNMIGTGHVMRCLTLAEQLMKANAQTKITFISRDLPGNLSELIKSKGFDVKLLEFSEEGKRQYAAMLPNDDYAKWLGVKSKQDAQEVLDVITILNLNTKIDLLIIDHYALDLKWERLLRPKVEKIMVIDDLANREHDCDIILDHNFYLDLETRYDKLVPKSCKKLLGPKHALINPKLKYVKANRARAGKGNSLDQIENVLVFLGGSDPKNFTDKALEKALSSEQLKGCLFNVVLGKNNPHKLELKQKYAQYDNVIFHVQPSYYYELLEKADLAIGAGGVSQLERCYIDLPSVVMVVADNQEEIVNNIVSGSYAIKLSQCFDIDVPVFKIYLKILEVLLFSESHLIALLSINSRTINIVCPFDSWFYPFAENIKEKMGKAGLVVNLLQNHNLVSTGSDITFYLSYPRVVTESYLKYSKNNIVVHASDLPKGRGWSPWVWEIINGSNYLTLSLFEVSKDVDSGEIYFKDSIILKGHELVNEIRNILGNKIVGMCCNYMMHKGKLNPQKQTGKPTFYKKRCPPDSKLDINKPLIENFNLLRVVDNDLYPAFFEYKNHRYYLTINKLQN